MDIIAFGMSGSTGGGASGVTVYPSPEMPLSALQALGLTGQCEDEVALLEHRSRLRAALEHAEERFSRGVACADRAVRDAVRLLLDASPL